MLVLVNYDYLIYPAYQRHRPELFPAISAPSEKVLALAALSVLAGERSSNLQEAERNSTDPHGT